MESIVKRLNALFEMSVEGSLQLVARSHQDGRVFGQGAWDRISRPLGQIPNQYDPATFGVKLINEIIKPLFQ
jgi:hypothetical protein